jgi:hypothetical protein
MANGKQPEIGDGWVEKSAGRFAPLIKWLRPALKTHCNTLGKRRSRAGVGLLLSQMTVIALGFVASLAAIYSKGEPPAPALFKLTTGQWEKLNILVPLVISALTSVFAFLDFRGRYVKNSTTFTAIGAIKAEIDFAVAKGAEAEEPTITGEMLDGWQQRINVAMAQYEEEWLNAISGGQG